MIQVIVSAFVTLLGFVWHLSGGGGIPAMGPLLVMGGGGIWLLISIIKYATRRTS